MQLYWQDINPPCTCPHRSGQHRAGTSWQHHWLATVAVNRNPSCTAGGCSCTQQAPAGTDLAAPRCLGLAQPSHRGNGRQGRGGGLQKQEEHDLLVDSVPGLWSSQRHKKGRDTGLQLPFLKDLGGLICLLIYIKIGSLVFCCFGLIFRAWKCYKREILSCWASWI